MVTRAIELEMTLVAAANSEAELNNVLETRSMMHTRRENAVPIARIIHLRNLEDISMLFPGCNILEKAMMLHPRISVVMAVDIALMNTSWPMMWENSIAPALPRR